MRPGFRTLFPINCWESQWHPVRDLSLGMERGQPCVFNEEQTFCVVQHWIFENEDYGLEKQVSFSSSHSQCSGKMSLEGVGVCCFYFLPSVPVVGISCALDLCCVTKSQESPNTDSLQRLIQLPGRWPGHQASKEALVVLISS